MQGTLRCGRFTLNPNRPLVMGIVNVTTDSFSGDGLGRNAEAAIRQAAQMAERGADMLDIGGESSRPGAEPVPLQQELDAVMPVLEAVRDFGLPVSIDTVKPEVMRAALDGGADLINDISALADPAALATVAAGGAGVCLMHMRGAPRTMQADPQYADVVGEVAEYLAGRAAAVEAAGIGRERIVVDPGFGFGKTLAHNLALLRHLDRIVALGWPVLVGMSRKSMLGAMTGRPTGEREYAGAAAAVLAAQQGARIFRVHDVVAARDALAVWAAVAAN
jgi:dihydropteroate synthase